MRLIKLVFLTLLWASATDCITPKATSIVREGSNLNAYNYVYVAPLKYENGLEDRYGVRAHVEQKLTKLRLKIISENEVKRLTPTAAVRVLFCSIQHSHSPDGMGFGGTYATVKIEMYDVAQKVIYSGSGRYQGLSVAGDLTGATDQALEGFVRRYKVFDPTAQPSAIQEIELESKRFSNWETIQKSKADIQSYFDENRDHLDQIEGIWTDTENIYQIGIIREPSNPRRDFVGIVIRTEQIYWKPGQVKIEIDATAYSSVYNVSYFMSDHTRQGTTASIDENGLLAIEVKQPDGSPLKMTFIKNYPSMVPQPRAGSKSGDGSGFILSKTGLIATNFHLVDGADNITVSIPGQEAAHQASVVLKDKNNDLAILKIDRFRYDDFYKNEIPYSIVDPANPQIGQEVFTMGYPLGSLLGKSAKLSKGIISSLFGIKDDPRLFQISNPIQPGNSGSPLFNMNGELIGIVVASLNAKLFYEQASIIPQNVNFAVKCNYLINLVYLLPEGEEIINRKSRLRGKSLEAQAEMIAPYIIAIEAR